MSKVLLVADAVWVENEVRAALSVGDWEIEVTSDPRSVVAAISEIDPVAVIVDMQVGSMGGMAVVREVRQLVQDRPRLVLLLDRSADFFLSRRAGADHGVLKPVEVHQLREAMAGLESKKAPSKAKTAPKRRRPSSTR